MKPLQAPDFEPQESSRQSDGPDLLSQVQVCARLGISDQTWMRWRKAGRTPEAIPLPSGRLKWRQQDIDRLTGTSQDVARRQFFGRHTAQSARLRVITKGQDG